VTLLTVTTRAEAAERSARAAAVEKRNIDGTTEVLDLTKKRNL